MCEESFRTVREAVIAQTKAIDAHPHDGKVYEDRFFTIIRHGGRLFYCGKPVPMRIPFDVLKVKHLLRHRLTP